MNKKTVLSIVLLFVFLFSTLTAALHFDAAQASTDFIGIISSDTTWTKANSPYTLTGPVKVEENATLTIEAGATVNLGSYYILVVGTLTARGSSVDPIHFNGGAASPDFGITFTDGSKGWNEQTGSGCVLENAIIASRISCGNSIKINNCSISAALVLSGSPTISNNTITNGISVFRGSAVIVNNTITAQNDAPAIAVSFMVESSVVISKNAITGNGGGVSIGGGIVYISHNVISGCARSGIDGEWGRAIIERNLIINNPIGIDIPNQSNLIIRNNTIANNPVGISITQLSPTINYNNIENCTQNSIYLHVSNNINATYNWWGTTDTQTINQAIHDDKNDFTLGIVSFVPFLTEPNPQAMPDENSPLPTPSSTPSPTPTLTSSPTPTSVSSPTPNLTASPTQTSNPTTQPTPSPSPNPTSSPEPSSTQTAPQTGLNEIEIGILAGIIVIIALLIALIALVLKKKQQN